ncbi:C40 family peptidase [Paenibacillus aceris]|uniref:Cell wall-associated NlpC family hydrolase n=1 Tax=Paenibacillus aceris TaxID=869555 RepID=A0ABS4I098_9BACL|nr:C40 family peptidase [Paenibacillus aceris]MBP1964334.1 cell wall-associated NlpC family hydrolase [Paenibacillus aceris]NHW36653.1 C40 family peptidase [Paenibacillus aceris]
MKLQHKWSKRLAVMTIGATIAISGGVISSPQPTQAATVSTSAKADNIISLGKKYMGTPYKFGSKVGQTRTFDCSTLTKYIYGKYGITLPRTAAQQSKVGSYVSKSNLKKGDLVFFSVPGRPGVGHVGVYLGNNKMLNTYGSGGVKITTLNSYWNSHYITARRVIK